MFSSNAPEQNTTKGDEHANQDGGPCLALFMLGLTRKSHHVEAMVHLR